MCSVTVSIPTIWLTAAIRKKNIIDLKINSALTLKIIVNKTNITPKLKRGVNNKFK